MIESFGVSKRGRDQLVTLKRRTGIEHWNVLCRWAFCVSLAEPHPPRNDRIPADSSVELTWHTFAGEYESVFLAALKQRCKQEGLDLTKRTLTTQFRRHLHRGLGYLAGDPNLTDIAELVSKAVEPK